MHTASNTLSYLKGPSVVSIVNQTTAVNSILIYCSKTNVSLPSTSLSPKSSLTFSLSNHRHLGIYDCVTLSLHLRNHPCFQVFVYNFTEKHKYYEDFVLFSVVSVYRSAYNAFAPLEGKRKAQMRKRSDKQDGTASHPKRHKSA